MSSRAALSAAADDRKARLAKLRSIKRKQPDDEVVAPESDRASPAVVLPSNTDGNEEGETTVERDVSRLHLSGRNYDPESRGARLGFEAPPNLAAGDDTLEAKASKLEAEVRRKQQEEEGGEEGDDTEQPKDNGGKPIDLFKLQPKKPNWDLKRELNKRLEPLNARTDNAIGRLVRERLSAKQPTKAQAEAARPSKSSSSRADESDEGGLEGAALVESIRLREQEDEEEERREREIEDEDA